MFLNTVQRRFLAVNFILLLGSCAATRYAPSSNAEELSSLVLIIKKLPSGQVAHIWQRAEDFDMSEYDLQSNSHTTYGRVKPAAARPRDCDGEHQQCYNDCMNRPVPRGYGHITTPDRKRGAKAAYCRDRCWQAYRDCLELQRLRPLEFAAADGAVEWSKENRSKINPNTIIVIAGVVFVAILVAPEAIVFAPLALLASSSGDVPECLIAEVNP
jgi:hypothetical protein